MKLLCQSSEWIIKILFSDNLQFLYDILSLIQRYYLWSSIKCIESLQYDGALAIRFTISGAYRENIYQEIVLESLQERNFHCFVAFGEEKCVQKITFLIEFR